MKFRSDNATGAAPEIMQALIDGNQAASHGYGADTHCARAGDMIKERLDAPNAKTYFVSTGTAANALALSILVKPYEVIYCHDEAHIEVDEAGAPEFFTNGCKLKHIDAAFGKLDPSVLEDAILSTGTIGVHNWQKGAVSITNATEDGAVYSPQDIKTIAQIAQKHDLPLHLDGARFANSVVSAGASAAEMSHASGVDVLVFGGTKNGIWAGEAVVIFDEALAWDFEMRRKRAGHLLSKGHFLGLQFEALMENDHWLDYARIANESMSALYSSISSHNDVQFDCKPEANIAFVSFPRAIHRALIKAGAEYYIFPATQTLEGRDDELIRARLVTSWATTEEDVRAFTKFFE